MGQLMIKMCECGDEVKQEKPNSQRKLHKIMTDHNYFFEDDHWFLGNQEPLFDTEKFILAYHNYELDQKNMEKHWKKFDPKKLMHGVLEREKNKVLAPKYKYLIRKGVPMNKMRLVLLDIFKRTYANNDMEYDTKLKIVFNNHIPTTFKNVPTFSETENLDEILVIKYLNEKGIMSLKRILWLVKETNSNLKYSPLLIMTITMLLFFLSESETYLIIRDLLEDSNTLLHEKNQYNAEEMRSVRWHFTRTGEEFAKFCDSFSENVSKKSHTFSKLRKHLEKVGFDFKGEFEKITKSFFFGYLTLPTILKIFIAFMNEGIKIIYRMAYGLLRVLSKKIIGASSDTENLSERLRHFALDLDKETIKKLFKKAYALRLNRIKKSFDNMKVDNLAAIKKAKTYYLPHVELSSSIIKDEQFETLWEWLPNLLKISDPKLVFSTEKDGFSLLNLYKKCEEYQKSSMFILVKTDRNSIFGAFCNEMLKIQTGTSYYGNDESFVFSLEPYEKKYSWTESNNSHCFGSPDYFSFGAGGDGVAFQLDSELNIGQTYVSETYKNDLLNGEPNTSKNNRFQCLTLELYAIV